MKNFDYTQFITFDSNLPPCILHSSIKEMFGELGFEVTAYDDMDTEKKEYYQNYWKLNLLCQMDVQNVCLIICSFAGKSITNDEVFFYHKRRNC